MSLLHGGRSAGALCLDLVVLLGVAGDPIIDRRIHQVDRTALPLLIVVQWFVINTWRGNANWWLRIADKMMG